MHSKVTLLFSTTHPTLSWRVREGFDHSPTLANLWQGLKEKVAAATTFSGFGKVDYVDLERDSAMLKQVWHCSCCLLGSQSFRPTGEP